MSEFLTRRMVHEDIDAVYAIEEASFKTPWTRNAFEDEIVKNTLAIYYVVESEGHVVGYGGMWMVMDELHITNVAIEPAHRGKGLSKKIMHALIDYGQSNRFSHMTLEVREHNQVAISLYEKLGFIIAGKRPKYYFDTGEDAFVMWKEL